MKKHLIVAAGLAVLSTTAFATKARLEALQQTNGRASFFLDDSRSVFLNPAKLNTMNNFVVSEWGTSTSVAETEAAPHAEGGFFRKSSSLAYGLYLGNEYGANNAAKTGMLGTDNVTELFFAGDMGVQWGAKISYSSNEDKPTSPGIKRTSDTMGISLGVISGNLEAYANLGLKDESKGGALADDKYEADMGTNIGVAYKMKGMTFHADYDKSGYETTITAVKADTEETTMSFGAARIHEVSKTSRFFFDLTYVAYEITEKVADTKTEYTALPLAIGFETEANSWLTLRAAATQNIFIGSTKVKGGSETTEANSTTVSAGATLEFGKLAIDGVIGSTGGSRAATTVGTKQGVLATDNLMTRVGVTYKF